MEKIWQDIAQSYGKANDLETKVRETMARYCAEKLPIDARILELGCGNGAFLKVLLDKNPAFEVTGIDSSGAMVEQARKILPDSVKLIHATVESYLADAKKRASAKPFNATVICNTLHNLENKEVMRRVIVDTAAELAADGYLLIDIRNSLNLFVRAGYAQNRSKGMQFFTSTPWWVSKTLKEAGFTIEKRVPIFYKSIEEAGKQSRSSFFRFLYNAYLKLTRLWFFSPFYVVVARKAQPAFVSIIWGYHKQFFGFSRQQNYQLTPLRLAADAGYKAIAYMIDPHVDIKHDPHFDPRTEVIKYSDTLSMIAFLWKHRRSTVYANSVIWQNFFLVPLLCRKAVFMAHDSIARRSRLKQMIEDAALSFYWRIRVIASGEKEFLVRQGTPAEKVFVVPMPIDNALFKPAITPGKDIVYLGNITPDNDIATILEAFSRVHSQRPGTKLHIIGENRVPEFHGLIKKYNIRDAVVEHGYVAHDQLAELLPTFAIYVNSVISSGQHLSVYEAALCGLALCLPNTMQFNTVFTDCALFHALYNPDALAANLLRYMNDLDLVHDHNKKARELILRRYTEQETSRELKELFEFKSLT